MTISDNLLDQTEQCLKNIQAALREAGADFPDPWLRGELHRAPKGNALPIVGRYCAKYFGASPGRP